MLDFPNSWPAFENFTIRFSPRLTVGRLFSVLIWGLDLLTDRAVARNTPCVRPVLRP